MRMSRRAGLLTASKKTAALLHMDTTSYTDESGKAWQFTSGTTVSTVAANLKFGSAALYCNGQEGYGRYVYTANHADFDYSKDFTIEFWFKATMAMSGKLLCGQGNGTLAANTLVIQTYGTTQVRATVYNGSTSKVITGGGVTHTNYNHIALVRSGDTLTLYCNGAVGGTADLTGFAITPPAYPLCVGSATHPPNYGAEYNGYIDEFRFSKCARWTSAFTPPTAAYTFD